MAELFGEASLRIIAVVAGLVVIGLGIRDLSRRRPRGHDVPVAGFFTMMSGTALLAEAWVLAGEFGLIGGVMLVFAGIATAFNGV